MSNKDAPSFSSGLVCRFDDVRIDGGSELVWKANRPLHLEPKAFQLLCYLINNRGRLIEKQELLDAVWGDTFVTENAMTRVIAQLRRALGDEAKEAKYIETAVKRGYRFIAEVDIEAEPRGVPEDRGPDQSKQRSLLWIAALGFVAVVVVIAGLMTSWREGESPVQKGSPLLAAQVTSSPGLEIFPALSSDGSFLAYSSDKSGNFEIYVKQLTPGGGEIQLTSDGQQNIQPTWSPDDQHVAYYSIERGGIWVVPAMGGRPKQITSFGSSPSWSPDGSQIAFQSQAPAGVFSSTYYAAMSISTIWECPSGGGEPTQITHAGEPPGGHGAPVWSPDGSRIGFVASDIDLSALWSMDPDGSQLKSLSRPRGRVYEFAYSPDGKHLFCVARTTDRFNLWKVPVEEDSRDPSEAVVLTDATPAVVRQVSVSGDGKKVAWSALSLNANLASIRISPDTYEPEENPVLLTDTSHYRDAHPRFSPDGQKVTFMRWMAGARRQLWLVDANGDNPEPLADTGGLSDWSTDGAQVYFAAWRESGAGIWSIDIDSRKEQFIFKPQIKHFFYRLSSDDRYIAVHSREGGVTNVWTMPVSGGEAQQITFDEEWAAYPCWSPDGKHLAYEFRRGKDIHIAVIPSQGGTPKQLTFDPGLSYVSSFSPDGDKIAFAGERNGIWNVFWVSRIDKKQLQLTSYTARNSYVRYPTWSPRGDQIVYEYAETIGDVWLAEIKE